MSIFGYTSCGSLTIACDPYIVGGIYTCPEEGTGINVTAFIETDVDQLFQCTLYDSNNDMVPNGITEEWQAPSQAAYVKHIFNFLVPPILTIQEYKICIWASTSTFGGVIYRDSIEGELTKYALGSYDSWPDPITWYDDISNAKLSIYCTYSKKIGPLPMHFRI